MSLRVKKTKASTNESWIYQYGLEGEVNYEEHFQDGSQVDLTLKYFVLGKAYAEERITDEGTTKYFYHHDHLGSVIALTDTEGKVVWEGDYNIYGALDSQNGSVDFAGQFTSKNIDPDTGLHYYNARWYDSDLGRFITEDPIGDGLNWYAYVGNSPMNRLDPTGLSDITDDEGNHIATKIDSDDPNLGPIAEENGWDDWEEAADYLGVRDKYNDDGGWIEGSESNYGQILPKKEFVDEGKGETTSQETDGQSDAQISSSGYEIPYGPGQVFDTRYGHVSEVSGPLPVNEDDIFGDRIGINLFDDPTKIASDFERAFTENVHLSNISKFSFQMDKNGDLYFLRILGGTAPPIALPGPGAVSGATSLIQKMDQMAKVGVLATAAVVAKQELDKKNNQKTYQIYIKIHPQTGLIYVGRTSGLSSPQMNVRRRDYNHHMSAKGFGIAEMQFTSIDKYAIRGLEQILIMKYRALNISANAINGISPTNLERKKYIESGLEAAGNDIRTWWEENF
jgi:RHS repeat-associated protein